MDHFGRMKAFVEIVDTGGFSAAARKLGRSKALMSKYVREIEDELGILLLNRTTRQFSLTEAGLLYYQSAQDILGRMDDLQDVVRESGSSLKGTLNVAAPRALIDFGFATPLVEFCERYPDLDVVVNLTDRMVNLVDEGFDVGIRITELTDSAMIVKKLSNFRMLLCASPAIVEKYGIPAHPRDLAKLPCILDGNLRNRNNWRFIGDGGEVFSVQVTGQLTVNSPETVRQALLKDMGFALIPEFSVAREIDEGQLVSLLEDRVMSGAGVYAVYPHRRHMATKVRVFVDFVGQWFKKRYGEFENIAARHGR